MPFQTVKDAQTGEERRVYVAPKGMGNAPKPAAKPAQGNNLVDLLSSTPLTAMMTASGSGLGGAVQELQRTGNLGQAFAKGQQAYMQALEGPGTGRSLVRVATNAGRNFLQETSDLLTADIPAAFGDRAIKPTSKAMPDAPFLGFLPPLAKAKSSGPAEDLATGIAQVAIEWLPATKAVGLVGTGLKALPGAAKVASAADKAGDAYRAAKAAQITKLAPKLQKPATVVTGAGEAVVSNLVGKGAATGALIDFAGFDQNEGRLTDLVSNLKKQVTGTPLEGPVFDYLKSKPGDVGVQGRLKNAVEGVFVGSTVEFLMRAFRAGKYVDRLRTAAPEDVPAAAAAAREATEDLQIEMVRQANTVPERGPELSVTQPQAAPIPDMQAPVYRDVAEVDPQAIAVDPQRFQFKEAGRFTKTGASGSLAESSGYNPELAGIISAWRDPADGVTYVVNGHNRLRLAKDDGTRKVLVRYLQAETAEEARAIGALQNIAEGQGTPVDAAKFMRDTGKTPEDMAGQGINMSGPVIAKAVPLTNLPQNLFDKVTTGNLDLAKAIALGSEALDGQVINDVAAEAIKRKWSADKITQAMQEAKFAQTETQGGGLLDALGDEWANKTSNFNQLLDIRTEAFRLLREEMVALTSAAREGRKGILEAAGNTIDVAGSRAARDQASVAVEVFNRVTGYTGPVRDLLNEMAGQVKGKRTAKTVVTENLDRLRQAIDDELNGPRLPLDEPAASAAAAPEPPAPRVTPEQSAETKALLDRALAVLPPEKRAAVQVELERRASGQALASASDSTPRATGRQLDPEFIKALSDELTEDIRRVAGDDVAIRFQQAFELRDRPKEWGGTGKPEQISYVGGSYDPIEDLIQLNGIGGDTVRNVQQTAFHEAFHRVQFNFLTESELKALNSFWAQLKLQVAADDRIKAVAKRGGRLALIEQQAVAFQKYAYARKEGLDPIAYMSGATEEELRGYRNPRMENGDFVIDEIKGGEKLAMDVIQGGLGILDTLLNFVESANNFIRGRGWTSINSIFEQAYSGKLAETRADLGNAYEEAAVPGRSPNPYPRTDILGAIRDMNIIPTIGRDNPYRGRLFSEAQDVPVNAPNPDEVWARQFVDQIMANRAAIEAGELTVDDLLANNVQKLESPSGAIKYQPVQPQAMVEAYRAHSDLVSRPDATGIPVMTDEQIISDTAAWLEKANYSSRAVLDNLQRLSGPLSAYRENLVAMRAAALYVDHTNLQAGIAANRWLNAAADDAADISKLTAELVTAAAQQDRANRAFESVTRPLGQLLRSTQVPRPEPGSVPFRDAGDVVDVEVMPPAKNVGADFEKELAKDQEELVADTIGSRISPEAREAIITGQYDNPKVLEEFNALALNMAQSAVTPGFSQGFWSKFNQGVSLGAKGLMMYRSSQLLSSGITLWGNVINSALRTVEMPFTQAMGAMITGHPVRASRSLMIYGQYVSNLANAFRMGVESFKVGRGLFDLDRSQVDFLDRLAAQDAQGQLIENTAAQGEWNLNTMPWVSVQDKANWAMAQKRLWQSLNLSSRLQVSVDSAFKSLVGQSFEYVRNLQPGLDHAVRLGMDGNSREAWRFAQDYAQAAVDRSLKDLTVDGKTILDAVMDSPSAQTATRWATFTDDVWAQMEPRTMQRGMELADAKGLKNAEAKSFAEQYVAKGQKVAGMAMDDIPFFARTFSLMPRIWQMGLDSPLGPLFALVQPFNRTPGDIVKSVARKTPLAPLVDTWWRDVFSEDAMTRDRAWGDIATGAAAISLASVAMTHGRIEFTGGGPTNPDARRKWTEQGGKQPYSMRFRTGEDENGNPVFTPWISMRAMDPLASLFGGLADYQELANKVSVEARERLGSALVLDLATAVATGQLQKSYYQGFTELYEMAMGLGETDIGPNRRHPTARYFERLIASFLPGSSALRAGRRIDDRTARDVPPSNNPNLVMRLFEETMGEIKNMIPGWSQSLPPKRNWITGEPVILSGVWGDQFLPPDSPWLSTLMQLNPASPFQLKDQPSEKVLREMGQLAGRGAGFVGPRTTDFTDGGKIKDNRLDPYEFEQYVLAISRTPDQFGRTLVQALDEEIQSDVYQSSTPEAPSERVISLRAAALNQVIAKYLQLGRETFLTGPYGKRLSENKDWAEGANRDVQFRLKYGQEIDPKAFVESLR